MLVEDYECGPEEEDGPWAEGWAERVGILHHTVPCELNANIILPVYKVDKALTEQWFRIKVKAFLLRKGHIHRDVFKFTLRDHLRDCYGFML